MSDSDSSEKRRTVRALDPAKTRRHQRTLSILIAAATFLFIGWRAITLYSRSGRDSNAGTTVRRFLQHALAADTLTLATLSAAAQPTRWALAVARSDSVALSEWSGAGGRMSLVRRRDTLWVTMRRDRSTAACPFRSALTAAMIPSGRRYLLVHLSATCPRGPTGR